MDMAKVYLTRVCAHKLDAEGSYRGIAPRFFVFENWMRGRSGDRSRSWNALLRRLRLKRQRINLVDVAGFALHEIH